MNRRSALKTLTTAAVSAGIVLGLQSAAGAWASSSAESVPGVASEVISPAPVIERGTRTPNPHPTLITTGPVNPEPIVTANPRPVADPPVVVTPTQEPTSAPAPVVTRNPRPVVEVPVVKGCAS